MQKKVNANKKKIVTNIHYDLSADKQTFKTDSKEFAYTIKRARDRPCNHQVKLACSKL